MAAPEHDAGHRIDVAERANLVEQKRGERLVNLAVEHGPFRVDVELRLATRRKLEPLAWGRDLHRVRLHVLQHELAGVLDRFCHDSPGS